MSEDTEHPNLPPEEEYTENFLKDFIEKVKAEKRFTETQKSDLLEQALAVKPGDKKACEKLAFLWMKYQKETDTDPKPKKPDKVPDTILICSNGCGFSTRWPAKQALQIKGRPAKTDDSLFLCPNCDRNGSSAALKPYT